MEGTFLYTTKNVAEAMTVGTRTLCSMTVWGAFLIFKPNARLSNTVIVGLRVLLLKIIAMSLSLGSASVTSLPPTVISPEDSSSRQFIRLSRERVCRVFNRLAHDKLYKQRKNHAFHSRLHIYYYVQKFCLQIFVQSR